MADIRYRCPNCAEKLCVHEAAAGMEILCPKCKHGGAVPHTGPCGQLLSIDIRFRCPACDKKMAVDVCHGGEVTRCPACHQPFTIPPVPEDSAAPDAPASVLTQDEVEFMTRP